VVQQGADKFGTAVEPQNRQSFTICGGDLRHVTRWQHSAHRTVGRPCHVLLLAHRLTVLQ
jgi:hypothetical protein